MNLKRGYYDVFIRTCAKYPSNTAVRHYYNGIYNKYTYSELYGVCEYLSQNLLQLNCNKGAIGLITERNIIIPCIIAAAHKCCTTFMFINPSQDIREVVDSVAFTILVTINSNEDKIITEILGKKPDITLTVFNLVINFYCCDLPSNNSIRYINQHSFIASTSGSTGEPKRIQVPIQCIQPNIVDLTKLFHITHQDIIYLSTPLTFDPSMVEILLACINGASLLIGPEKADVLFPLNQENSITIWQTTPSKFHQFSNADIRNKVLSANSSLRILALGGEPLNGLKRLTELKDLNNKTKIYTLYGVTEMSCWACVAELDLSNTMLDREVPLGNCLSETEVVLQPTKQQLNTGKIILVSKTRQCYILNKSKGLEDQSSLKFIDTGDYGENKNGTVYYRGRKDDIVKRFGHKISLQLIESTVMLCPRVKACSCLWLPKPLFLVIYFSSESLSSRELADFLKCKLDDKHWPDKVIRVNNLPTNPHGKISKFLISRMFNNENKNKQEPLLNIEALKFTFLKELKVSLCRNFSYDQIQDKNFFSIGGTSFLAVTMCNKLSYICPQFGAFILPHLMTEKYTIGQVILMAHKELCVDKNKTRKRRLRLKESFNECASKKTIESNTSSNPVEFVLVWTFDMGKCVDASPVLFQTEFNLYVTVGSHSGKLVVMDAIGGHIFGQLQIKSRIEASVMCYSDSEMSPRGVVGAHDGTIICFTLADCMECWRINIGSMIKSKAVCCNRIIYIAAYDGAIRCIDLATGEIKDKINVIDQAISADLVVAKKEYILLGTLTGVCASIHAETNIVAWRGSLTSPVFASPVLYDDDKYVVFAEVNGEIHCRTVEKGIKNLLIDSSPLPAYSAHQFNRITNAPVIWRYQGAKGNIFSSLYIKEIQKMKWQMVFGCHDNKVYSIYIKNFQPNLQWRTPLTSPVYSTPCGINDKFVLAASNNGKLCIIDSDSGVIVTEYSLPNETFSSPAVFGDYIFIGCRNDHLYSIKYIMHL